MGRYDALYQSLPSPAHPAAANPVSATPPQAAPQPTSPVMQPTVREFRADAPNDRTAGVTDTLLDEIAGDVPDHRRPTERYSFEIYSDQKPQIEELQYRFKQRTGTKLSSSRIIREAIEAYLPEALRLLAIPDQPPTVGGNGPAERRDRTVEANDRTA